MTSSGVISSFSDNKSSFPTVVNIKHRRWDKNVNALMTVDKTVNIHFDVKNFDLLE